MRNIGVCAFYEIIFCFLPYSAVRYSKVTISCPDSFTHFIGFAWTVAPTYTRLSQ